MTRGDWQDPGSYDVDPYAFPQAGCRVDPPDDEDESRLTDLLLTLLFLATVAAVVYRFS